VRVALLWRSAWADVTNRHLERIGVDARIDHRSHAASGILEQPTIHEGVTARAMEKQGMVADRCELNGQIKADNKLLRGLRSASERLTNAVENSLPAIAEAMETMRQYADLVGQIKGLSRERQGLLDEKKQLLY